MEKAPPYKCQGWYVVSHWTTESETLSRWGALSNRANLTRVIFLRVVERVGIPLGDDDAGAAR